MEFTKKTYRKLGWKAGRRQDYVWRAYRKFQRANGYVTLPMQRELSATINFKSAVYNRWWRERRGK